MRLDTPPLYAPCASRIDPAGPHSAAAPVPVSAATKRPADAAGIALEIGAAGSAQGPFDAARVERLRAALVDGSYALRPQVTATAMVAAQRSLASGR